MLDAAALRVKQDRVTTVWIPRNEKVNERAMTVEVSGQLKTFITDKLTSQLDKAYLVQFSVTTSGRLYVLKVEEVVKRDSAAKPAAAQP
jgi:conjugal transfer pilus assembly protein TraE